MDVQQLLSLLNGGAREIRVARVSRSVMTRLEAHEAAVFLSRPTLLEQLQKHAEIALEDYLFIQDIIDRGLVVVERDRPTAALVILENGEVNRALKLVIKRTRNGGRLYVTSFHRLRLSEARRLIRRAAKGSGR
jgi:hypothetical protein